jgi:hypothetical protein
VATGSERPLDVMTGRPAVRAWWFVPLEWATPGEHTVTVRLGRPDGSWEGPWSYSFAPEVERLAAAKAELARLGDEAFHFAEHGDEVTWLGFSPYFELRRSLREVRYSVDDCSLARRIVFAGDPAGEPHAEPAPRYDNDLRLGRPFLSLPKASTRSACAQAVFSDGTLSPVARVRREPGSER